MSNGHDAAGTVRGRQRTGRPCKFPPGCFDPACITDFTDVAPDGSVVRGIEATNAALVAYFDGDRELPPLDSMPGIPRRRGGVARPFSDTDEASALKPWDLRSRPGGERRRSA